MKDDRAYKSRMALDDKENGKLRRESLCHKESIGIYCGLERDSEGVSFSDVCENT
jgi:hypothetical protein